jgi:hypothetical protein
MIRFIRGQMENKKSNNKSIKEKIILFLHSTQFLTLGLICVGFGFLLIILIFQELTNRAMPDVYRYILVTICFVFQAASAIFVIKRKELPRPGLPSVTGTWAVIQGILWLILMLLGVIVSFVFTLRSVPLFENCPFLYI